MRARSIVAAQTKAIRIVREALRPPGTLAYVGNMVGIVRVTDQPTNIYARLKSLPTQVIVAQIGATPPADLETLNNWLVDLKEIVEAGTVSYRVINWLQDAYGRSVADATYFPSLHYLDPAEGVHAGTLDAYYFTETELGGSGGAVLIGIADAGGYYVATNVEAALQELLGPTGAKAYRYAFSDEDYILFDNPFSNRPAVTVHFDTTVGFGTQPFGTSGFGGIDYWTQEGSLATAIESITFPPGQIKVVLSAAASGEVLCHA